MNIKVLQKADKEVEEFEHQEWDIADQEHYGKIHDWTPEHFVIAAYEDEKMVGVLEAELKVGVFEIDTLIISSAQRRKGVGKQLLDKAEEIAREKHAHKIYLITGKGWPAENFYLANGMTKTGELEKHHTGADFVAYSKFL